MSHWALEVAPMAALANIDSPTGMLSLLACRLKISRRLAKRQPIESKG
jgi:hypothetical protein